MHDEEYSSDEQIEETGSDELLSADNLRLPESASILVRLHAVRAWLARRLAEASLEVGEAALDLQQAVQAPMEETGAPRRRRQSSSPDLRIARARQTLAATQQRLSAYEEAQTLLEECVSHTTSSERVLVEYYLSLEALLTPSSAGHSHQVDHSIPPEHQQPGSPWYRAFTDVLHRVERVGVPGEEET